MYVGAGPAGDGLVSLVLGAAIFAIGLMTGLVFGFSLGHYRWRTFYLRRLREQYVEDEPG